ncbi:MAG: SAM-dependent DNA methyltransferase [Treponema sp.]|nr:SAM-dependent DNA methyltransferase [Treponema sp.]
MLTQQEQKIAAKEFAQKWIGRGDEKSETHNFWIELLRSVLGVENPESFIEFEKRVQLDHTSFIDGYIPATQVLIEQKSIDIDLKKAYKQSDESVLTPYQQARRYAANMKRSEMPRWIVTCNFKSFLVYDMEKPNSEPEEILLENLEKEFYRLSFLANTGNVHLKREMELSIKAGEIVGQIYDKLLKQYKNPDSAKTLKSLNMLCVRIVFCLYAEDAGLFNSKSQFHDYIDTFNTDNIRQGLINLFKVLDTKVEERDEEIEDKLAAFPYVNGGLFTEEDLSIPQFNEELRQLLLEKASEDFDWSEISPTIFGAVFESTLNPETRRSGGMHYTSIENIHKVIDPLFLNDLKNEFESIKEIKTEKTRNGKLIDFQKKLGSLKFLDPACGSGNFLTESYISLRKLENECLRLRFNGETMLDVFNDAVFVSIHQFYGIEINDFAVTVAKTALWIAESQMIKETSEILQRNLDFLPLKSYANIVEGNALRIDWENIIPKNELNYIMGNPPFVGAMWMKGEKREDVELVFPECEKAGEIDYVSGWYAKASKYIQDTKIQCAFVSTNSISQGQQVALIWKPLFEKYNIKFNFAYRTFQWDSEASLKAHVHCIIIGFCCFDNKKSKTIYLNEQQSVVAKNINGYLTDADNIFITGTKEQISKMPTMHMGVMARDGGNLILSEEEYQDYIKKEPLGKQWIHRYMMGKEFINNIPRYCFWLVGANPSDLRKCPLLLERIEKVRKCRLESSAKETQKLADNASLFAQLAQPSKTFIAFPKVSSEQRRYIPIGFLSPDIIVGDKVYVVEDVGLYHFGILTSNVHNAWMRAVAGRLEMRYSYSNTIVYNSFPWPTPSDAQKSAIEKTAQSILDARAKYPTSSLADLYDEAVMPPDLRKAHQENDKAVMAAYGFDYKKMTESECVAELFKLYEKLVK